MDVWRIRRAASVCRQRMTLPALSQRASVASGGFQRAMARRHGIHSKLAARIDHTARHFQQASIRRVSHLPASGHSCSSRVGRDLAATRQEGTGSDAKERERGKGKPEWSNYAKPSADRLKRGTSTPNGGDLISSSYPPSPLSNEQCSLLTDGLPSSGLATFTIVTQPTGPQSRQSQAGATPPIHIRRCQSRPWRRTPLPTRLGRTPPAFRTCRFLSI